MCHIDQFIKLIKALVNIESLVSSLAGAFFGALFAYFFSVKLKEKKERSEQLSFLTYAIFSMAGVVGKLYIAKKNFVIPRNEEMKTIKEEIEKQQQNKSMQISIKMLELTKFMQTNKFALPFHINKIDFLAGKEPEVVHLICSLNASLEVLNQIIYDYNTYLSNLLKTGSPPNIDLIFSFVDNLSEQVDETLYLAEKVQEILIKYGKTYFKKTFKIKSLTIKDEWTTLSPPKINHWENINFFQKKSIIDKLSFKKD